MKRFKLPVAAFVVLSLGGSWRSVSAPDPKQELNPHSSGIVTEALPGPEMGRSVGHKPTPPEWTKDPRATLAVQAAGRGNPWVNFLDGREVPTRHTGPEEFTAAIRDHSAHPKALASADFDEDGVPDLLVAYEAGPRRAGGAIVFRRGNADAIYPEAPEAKQRKAKGTFTDAPFLPDTKVLPLPAMPKFIGAGDFDADGHWDAVSAEDGAAALYWLPGDGKGGFAAPRRVELPGRVTAFATGDVNRRDGLTDVVVTVTGPAGHQLLVFEGAEGALAHEPEVFLLPAPATSVALDHMDEDYPVDIVVAAGNHLLVIQGRDRRLSLNEAQRAKVKPATVDKTILPFTITSMATGNFDGDRARGVAILSELGDLYQVPARSLLASMRTGADPMKTLGNPHLAGIAAKEIL